MQNPTRIREILAAAGVQPSRRLGQNFLIDKNLMRKLLDLAELGPAQTVLEVGAGTGSLTEELLAAAAKVVAVEIDRRLCRHLAASLTGGDKLTLICGDVLAGKHMISEEVLSALRPRATMVSNLPYSIATPLLAVCLWQSWRAVAGRDAQACLFESMTFTVQKEVSQRLVAGPGSRDYGQISVLVALLGRVTLGPAIPASAFWPRPKVASRMMRIDFDAESARTVDDFESLRLLLTVVFGQRRKQIGAVLRTKCPDSANKALAAAGIDPSSRAEQLSPESFALLAKNLPVGPGEGQSSRR